MGDSRYRPWGGWRCRPQRAIELGGETNELLQGIELRPGGLLPFGNGRSYGDVCLNTDGRLLDTRRLNRLIEFDEETGVIRCEGGVLFADVLRLVVPCGWFLPVTPGTQLVTVGGAIANDVHGKNHHRVGSFCGYVRRMGVLRSDGTLIECSREDQSSLFYATLGGLGLTGLIVWAEFSLKRVSSPDVLRETQVFRGVREFIQLSVESGTDYEYTVGWIDCVARGADADRGLFWRANHAVDEPRPRRRAFGLGLPCYPPCSLVGPRTVRWFNALYFHRGARATARSRASFESFFYPLDAIANWNRAYGRKGFLQYQLVVPHEHAVELISEVLERIRRAQAASMLTVLKVFGSRVSGGLLSFPRPGVTLAVDLPAPSTALLHALEDIDRAVAEAGGAVYPAKDARMSAASFRRFFPRWREFLNHVDPAFGSDFCRRVMQQEERAVLHARGLLGAA